ncbi:hypothetical protein GLAREA_02447 [Glarea lozoyensis ATCC 20868]|uniref:Uncharacterized protein n=1 Tax=Glarea lozoyensis (strain ATCC 20868 / MF5171) TaxID=1116229 RepID=S3CMU6_GLAL2|nr:uncharacterized protein GLAREA_02447 [Glarea lozoyensis ATCC 20868]EPE26534.1 hypothetical protein GLAREA_02447 [Glarea lozoyensis ATCC 20868]
MSIRQPYLQAHQISWRICAYIGPLTAGRAISYHFDFEILQNIRFEYEPTWIQFISPCPYDVTVRLWTEFDRGGEMEEVHFDNNDLHVVQIRPFKSWTLLRRQDLKVNETVDGEGKEERVNGENVNEKKRRRSEDDNYEVRVNGILEEWTNAV